MIEPSKPNSCNYKSYVGPPNRYDFMGATQFRLLSSLGLRAHHKLLDFGCGSLRSGKLFIPYLNSGNYYGQDPNQWLIDAGIQNEIGDDIIEIKKPNFSNLDNFEIGFNATFDFIVAQSIFSHTNYTLAKKGIRSIYHSLSEDGLAVFTFIEGDDYNGKDEWVYPGCTTFKRSTISGLLNDVCPHWRRLYWFHPAQTWFIMAKHKSRLPSFWETFLLLGGEEVGSKQYKNQQFLSNRLTNLVKKYK